MMTYIGGGSVCISLSSVSSIIDWFALSMKENWFDEFLSVAWISPPNSALQDSIKAFLAFWLSRDSKRKKYFQDSRIDKDVNYAIEPFLTICWFWNSILSYLYLSRSWLNKNSGAFNFKMVNHDFLEGNGFELRMIKTPSLIIKTIFIDLNLVHLVIIYKKNLKWF